MSTLHRSTDDEGMELSLIDVGPENLHCNFILILFSLHSVIIKMSVIKGKFNFK